MRVDINVIREVIERNAAGATGKLGVYFMDLSTGAEVRYNAEDVFPSASVFKIFVLAELFRQIGSGRCALEDRYPLKSEDKAEGSGVLQLLEDGAELTLKDYATLMMILSDNTAADFLFKFTGRENIIRNVLEPLHLRATKCDLTCTDLLAACYEIEPGTRLEESLAARCGRGFRNAPAYTGGLERNDETSPEDAAKVLELLYRGQWISPEWDAQAVKILKQCQTNGRIPKFLPVGTAVAHKTGTMDRVANDVGIVYSPKGDYILSLFYNGNTASEEEYRENDHNFFSENLLAVISREIYDAYVGA